MKGVGELVAPVHAIHGNVDSHLKSDTLESQRPSWRNVTVTSFLAADDILCGMNVFVAVKLSLPKNTRVEKLASGA